MSVRKFKHFALIIVLLFALINMAGCFNTTDEVFDNTPIQTTTIQPIATSLPDEFKQTETAKPVVTPIYEENATSKLKVRFIDVGQGDSIYISLPNGRTMLIDAGDNGYGDRVVNYVKSLSVSKIDYLIASHPDADHIGGMDTVINNLEIGNVFMPDITSTTDTFEAVLSAIENKHLSITIAEAGMTLFDYGNLKVVFVAPVSKTSDANNMSAVLYVSYGSTAFLFTGDAEKESEKEILNCGYNIKADVLKVGHHGSDTSSTMKFIKAVSPKYAIISCGKDNKYGHPDAKTLSTLKEVGAQVYRTDEAGTIIATSDGESITIDKNATEIKPNAPPQNPTQFKTATPTPEVKPETSQNQSVEVFITKTGKRYHLGHCSSLSKSKISMTLEDAKKSGYTACNNCHPPQ